MFIKRLLILLLVSFVPLAVFAQSSGKITGHIVDEATNEALVGVNVVIENTTMGANTDVDGYYFILNVPVGAYSVRASTVGYTETITKNVRVSSNTTTEINFTLKETTVDLGEVIVVTAERPLVEKNVTQSYSLVTSETIEAIPVRGMNGILDLQASVVVQDGDVHIRGGRPEETGYYLDGANIVNPMTNTPGVYIIQEAVEEVQVLAGGYTAEFGGANSGIVKTELKSGAEAIHMSVDAQTDNFVANGEKFLDTYSYGNSIVGATFSGPVVSKNVRLFAAVENEYWADWRTRFSKGFTFENLVDENPVNPDVAGGNPDTVTLNYLPGYTPRNNQNRWAINSTLLFDFKPYQLRLSGVASYTKQRNSATPMINMLNTRQLWTNFLQGLFSARFTHIITPTTFYDVKVSYYTRYTETEDNWFGTDWQKWADSTAVSDYTNGDVTFVRHHSNPYNLVLLGFPFTANGANPGNYVKSEQNYIGGNLDFVTQFNKYNEFKAGAEARYYTMRQYSVEPAVMGQIAPYGDFPDLKSIDDATWAEWSGNTYGYDFLGKKLDSGFNGARHPLFGAFYVQDKLEFKDLIINAGLRLDYFDSDDYELANPANFTVVDGQIADWIAKDPFMQISPRLGISFPISDKTVFYTQYGKFVQTTQLNDIYYNSTQFARQMVRGGYYYLQPAGFDADPMRTTQYEIGFRQQIGENAAIDIAGFYKNIIGQTQVQKVPAEAGAQNTTYYTIGNGDFATTRGIEIRLTLRRIERLQAQLNYTLSSAEGTGSNETAYYSANYNGTAMPTITSPLDFNQTHRGSLLLDYRFGPNDGGPVLQNLGANMIFSFSSGHAFTFTYAQPGGQADPYTAGTDYMQDTRSREAMEPMGASTTPWNYNIDLRLDKSFNIYDKLMATVYVRVNNLLNTKNVINVFPTTGTATDDGYISDPTRYATNVQAYGQQYLDLYRAVNIENGQAYLSQAGVELYGPPRQIWFGIKFNY
jgi:hypothetical protein